MTELRLDEIGTHEGQVMGQRYGLTEEAPASRETSFPEDITIGETPREFSLKSFKCFAREHPLILGFGAAGFGAAMATFGAGYMIYRGAQRSLPVRMLKMSKFVMTF